MKIQNDANNSTSFQAKLNLGRMSNDAERLAKIGKIFEEKTSEFPKDTFYGAIRKEDGTEFYNFTGKENAISMYIDKKFSSIMEKLSDNEVAEKLAKMFKVLKKDAHWEKALDRTEVELERTEHLAAKNEALATSAKASGMERVAKMYDVIAGRQKAHHSDLKTKYDRMCVNYREDLRKISGGDEDLETFITASR